jgi:hypothetical protein
MDSQESQEEMASESVIVEGTISFPYSLQEKSIQRSTYLSIKEMCKEF